MTTRYVRATIGDSSVVAPLEVSDAPPPSGLPGGVLPNGHPIPAGLPTHLETGWRGAGATLADLTPYNGTFITSADGQVVEGLDISQGVDLAHNNVTFRTCRIGSGTDGSASHLVRSVSASAGNDATFEHCEVRGFGNNAAVSQSAFAVFRVGLRLYRCEVSRVEDGLRLVTGAQAIECLVHDLGGESAEPHSDCFQLTAGDDWLVQRCSLVATRVDWDATPVDDGFGWALNGGFNCYANAAIQIGNQTGPINRGVVEDCYLSGGNYSVNDNTSNEDVHGPIDITYRNNIFSGFHRYGPDAAGGSAIVRVGNVGAATRKTYGYDRTSQTPNKWYQYTEGQPVPTDSTPL